MLNCASVYTYEIDQHSEALNEIKMQLDNKMKLLDNTIGIVMCHPEFINSGTLRYICDNLPFDVVGVTTASQAVNDETGEMILTIFVMTSDDVRFKTGVALNLDKGIDESVKAAYDHIAGSDTETPGLALVFPQIIQNYAGDDYIKALQQYIPDTPMFGTLAMDDTPTFEESETIYKGENSNTSMPFVFCYGNINPRFIIGTIPEEKVMHYTGEITKSTGPLVHEINGLNTYKYFESIGFESNGTSSVNYLFLPFSIDQKKRSDYDGVPVIRVLSAFTDEGTAIFHGNVDEGSTFNLLKCESDDVLATASNGVTKINEMTDVNGVLLFSCIVRRIVTMSVGGAEANEEFKTVKNELRPDIEFMMGCAGGEICPTLSKDGKLTNRYHNYSLVILVV